MSRFISITQARDAAGRDDHLELPVPL